MKFERGKDPKEALKVGLKKRVKDYMAEILESQYYHLLTGDTKVKDVIEDAVKEKFDIDIKVHINFTTNNVRIDWPTNLEKIENKITITKDGL